MPKAHWVQRAHIIITFFLSVLIDFTGVLIHDDVRDSDKPGPQAGDISPDGTEILIKNRKRVKQEIH